MDSDYLCTLNIPLGYGSPHNSRESVSSGGQTPPLNFWIEKLLPEVFGGHSSLAHRCSCWCPLAMVLRKFHDGPEVTESSVHCTGAVLGIILLLEIPADFTKVC